MVVIKKITWFWSFYLICVLIKLTSLLYSLNGYVIIICTPAMLSRHVREDILNERAVGCRLDPVTGKIYHLKYSPPEIEQIAAILCRNLILLH